MKPHPDIGPCVISHDGKARISVPLVDDRGEVVCVEFPLGPRRAALLLEQIATASAMLLRPPSVRFSPDSDLKSDGPSS